MKRTRSKISNVRKRVQSEAQNTMKSLNGGIEKMEQEYELVFKVKKSHLY